MTAGGTYKSGRHRHQATAVTATPGDQSGSLPPLAGPGVEEEHLVQVQLQPVLPSPAPALTVPPAPDDEDDVTRRDGTAVAGETAQLRGRISVGTEAPAQPPRVQYLDLRLASTARLPLTTEHEQVLALDGRGGV